LEEIHRGHVVPNAKAYLATPFNFQSSIFCCLAWGAFPYAPSAGKEKLNLSPASGTWACAVGLEEFLES
jgi:hypothetical protein